MATHSSILVWRIPWTREPGRLQSMGLQRVKHDLATTQITTINLRGFLYFFFQYAHLRLSHFLMKQGYQYKSQEY